MMLAWSFAARTAEEVARLLRALGKHRYVREVEHKIHWSVDQALADHPAFAEHARAFEARRRREPELDVGSLDPSLWRVAPVDDVIAVLSIFWAPDEAGQRAREQLLGVLLASGLSTGFHKAFDCPPDQLPHPELITLSWTLLPVDELDAERHVGALTALEESGDEINPSEPIFQEGPVLAAPELTAGAQNGVLWEDFLVWSDGPYSYADYVFRGVSRSAKLVEPPVGYRDI